MFFFIIVYENENFLKSNLWKMTAATVLNKQQKQREKEKSEINKYDYLIILFSF